MDRQRTQICAKCKSNCAIFNHFTFKYGLNRLTGVCCARRWCSHKIFSCPTTAGLPAKLNSAQLRNPASRRPVPGIDYDSAINVHICRNGVLGRLCPRHVGGIWEPGLMWWKRIFISITLVGLVVARYRRVSSCLRAATTILRYTPKFTRWREWRNRSNVIWNF